MERTFVPTAPGLFALFNTRDHHIYWRPVVGYFIEPVGIARTAFEVRPAWVSERGQVSSVTDEARLAEYGLVELVDVKAGPQPSKSQDESRSGSS